jgi:hypothetical protein
MRKTILAIGVLLVAWLGYVMWPLYDLVQITRAFERRDVPTLTAFIHFRDLRASLTRELIAAYVKRVGARISPMAQTAAEASSIADPIIAKLITPEAVAALMTNGWPVTVVPEKPAGVTGLTLDNLGTAWQLFAASEYGVGHFEVSVPATLPVPQRFVLGFRLAQWRWKLVRITLPESIQNLLADELIKTLKRSAVTL